jgi:GWxTD domain-containing protein
MNRILSRHHEVSMTIRLGAVLLGLAVGAGAAMAAGEPPDWKTPTKDWTKGPVRWLMDDTEEKDFKKLKSDEERQAFAKTFWEKRDPTPGTPENEYMAIFWQRVEQADAKYKDMIRQGSTTDLGRVFILMGPPAATHKDSRYLYWNYEPNEVTGIKEKLEFSFATVDTGTLLRSPKTLEAYVAGHPETRGIGWTLPKIAAAPAGEPTAAPVKDHVEDTSPETQRQIPIIDAVVAKKSGPTDVPFQVVDDFYAAADGTTLVVITVEVPREAAHGSGNQAVLAFGRLQPEAEGGRVFNLTGDLPFVPAPEADAPSGGLVYQARRNLKAGNYTLAIVVEDRVVKGQMGTLVTQVSVPDFSAKAFAMSSITLLASFRQAEAGIVPAGAARHERPDAHRRAVVLLPGLQPVPRPRRRPAEPGVDLLVLPEGRHRLEAVPETGGQGGEPGRAVRPAAQGSDEARPAAARRVQDGGEGHRQGLGAVTDEGDPLQRALIQRALRRRAAVSRRAGNPIGRVTFPGPCPAGRSITTG